MKTDVQIAQEAKMLPIVEIAKKLGLDENDIIQYGKYKAKINLKVLERFKDKQDGKLVLVTAINPHLQERKNYNQHRTFNGIK